MLKEFVDPHKDLAVGTLTFCNGYFRLIVSSIDDKEYVEYVRFDHEGKHCVFTDHASVFIFDKLVAQMEA